MSQRVEPYNDIRDLIEDSLDELARRRAKYPGDNLAAIRLLADLVEEAQGALAKRLTQAAASGTQWEQIAEVLGTTPTETRIRFEDGTELDHAWLSPR